MSCLITYLGVKIISRPALILYALAAFGTASKLTVRCEQTPDGTNKPFFRLQNHQNLAIPQPPSKIFKWVFVLVMRCRTFYSGNPASYSESRSPYWSSHHSECACHKIDAQRHGYGQGLCRVLPRNAHRRSRLHFRITRLLLANPGSQQCAKIMSGTWKHLRREMARLLLFGVPLNPEQRFCW